MKKQKNDKIGVPDIIAFALIFLFTYTASGKLFDHSAFYLRLSFFPLIGNSAFLISWLIPASELFISVLLLFRPLRIKGFYGSVLLLTLFSIYLFIMLYHGGKLPCSCGGIIEYLSWNQHILLNLFFIFISGIAIWLERKKIQRQSDRPYVLPV